MNNRIKTYALLVGVGVVVGATWGCRQGVRDRRQAMARLEWRTAESPGAAIRRGYR